MKLICPKLNHRYENVWEKIWLSILLHRGYWSGRGENARARSYRERQQPLIRRNRSVCLKADGCSDVRDSRLTGAFKHLLLMPLALEYRVLGRVTNERVICPSSFACRSARCIGNGESRWIFFFLSLLSVFSPCNFGGAFMHRGGAVICV